MRAARHPLSLRRLLPQAWRVRAVACLLLVFSLTSIAATAHAHDLDSGKADIRDSICGLCLHAERLAPPPPLFLQPVAVHLGHTLVPELLVAPLPAVSPSPYRSRAPPA